MKSIRNAASGDGIQSQTQRNPSGPCLLSYGTNLYDPFSLAGAGTDWPGGGGDGSVMEM